MNAVIAQSNEVVSLTDVSKSGRLSERVFTFTVRAKPIRSADKATETAPKTLAEANQWLNANWKKAVKHARVSTKRLIGRDSV